MRNFVTDIEASFAKHPEVGGKYLATTVLICQSVGIGIINLIFFDCTFFDVDLSGQLEVDLRKVLGVDTIYQMRVHFFLSFTNFNVGEADLRIERYFCGGEAAGAEEERNEDLDIFHKFNIWPGLSIILRYVNTMKRRFKLLV